ncbi:MAG TPA: helix-turn-helix transcriptional regulator [Acidimicrobiales bacterium]|nr:helix-turn-helix transcriptional regulator [Acidimicrobiales bacterium]
MDGARPWAERPASVRPKLGRLLMEARLDASLSRRDLARAVGVDTAKVRAWERSDKVPAGVDLQAVADVCGVSVDVLVPPRQPLWFDPVHGRLVVGEQEVRIDPSVIGNEGVLRCYLSMVRCERGVEADAPVTLRLDDLEVLAIALDVSDRQLEQQLVTLAGISEQSAADIRRRLVRRRAPTRVAALAIGVLSAVPVVHVRTTHHSDVPQTPGTAGVGAEAPVEIGEALTIERGTAQP